jgi:hypothetical protein
VVVGLLAASSSLAESPRVVDLAQNRTFASELPTSSDVNFTFALKDFMRPPRKAEYHCISGRRVFVIAGSAVLAENTVHVYDIQANLTYAYVGELNPTVSGDPARFGEPNSCNTANGYVFVVVTPFEKIGLAPGKLMVYNAQTLALVDSFDVGYNPDMVGLIQSPSASPSPYGMTGYAVTANEGEPQLNGSSTVFNYPLGVAAYNPVGGVSILDLQTKSVCTIDFNFNLSESTYRQFKIHNDQPNTVNTSYAIEPEYVAFDPQRPDRAFVVCQEANLVAEVLLSSALPCTIDARVFALRPLGLKPYTSDFPMNKISKSDQDGSGNPLTSLSQSVFS